MGINISAKRSGFYGELPHERQKDYFNLTLKKFMPTIDNLYYSIFIKDDGFEETNSKLAPLLEELAEKKEESKKSRQPVLFNHGLQVMPVAIKTYSLRLSEPDLYDIFFISGNLPNNNTNRIHSQLRAFGLWTRGTDTVFKESFTKVENLLSDYDLTINRVQENRIDYCFHTNIKTDVDKIFNKNGDVRYLETPLCDYICHGKKYKGGNGTKMDGYYYTFGSSASTNWIVRIYDKVREVIDKSYKGFFFKMWQEDGLISYYDRWCFEYAFLHQDFEYMGKARIAFYVEHGTDAHRVEKYSNALASENTTLAEFKRLADEFMPPTTTVINIEFQTMREFYRRSDGFINLFDTLERDYPPLLKRIYQILDNRDIFLQYLHGDGFSFYNGLKEDGTPNYLDWWNRLRNTKVDGIKATEKLLRDYAYNLDKASVARQGIRKVSSFSAYDDRIKTDELDDLMYFVSSLTDNMLYEADKLSLVRPDGTVVNKLSSPLLSNYKADKSKQNKQIKNRKKRLDKKLDMLEASPKQPQAELTATPVVKDIDGYIYAEVLDNTQAEQLPEGWQ